MYDNQKMQLPAITAFTVGQQATTRILNGVRTKEWRLEITATLTIAAGGATTILNDGSLAALFTNVILNENGDLVCQSDARAMAFRTLCQSAGTVANKRLDAVAAGVYALRETIILPFGTNLSIAPWETPFVEKNPFATTTVGFQCNPVSMTNMIGILTTSANACTLSALNVNVVQVYDTNDPKDPRYQPLFRARFRDISQAIVGATFTDQAMLLQLGNPLRDFVIQQDSTPAASANVEVSDIITAYQFRTDTQTIDGNGQDVTFADVNAQQPIDFAGAASAQRIVGNISGISTVGGLVNPSYLYRYFQASGRLSNILNPATIGQNPRLLLTGGAGAGTAPVVRLALAELEKVIGVTRMDQRFTV